MTLAERARDAAASYWTAGFAYIVMSALHWRWLWRSTHASDVLSAYGAGLVVLGLLVAARPFIRAGVRRMAEQDVQAPQFGGWATAEYVAEGWAAYRIRVDAVIPDVWAERVAAIGVLVVGTLLNGWGTPLARRWGLPV